MPMTDVDRLIFETAAEIMRLAERRPTVERERIAGTLGNILPPSEPVSIRRAQSS